MDNEGVPSRMSSRLAGKRKHSGRFCCPCCVKDDQTDSSMTLSPKKQKLLNVKRCAKVTSVCDTSKETHDSTDNNTSPITKRRGRPRKKRVIDDKGLKEGHLTDGECSLWEGKSEKETTASETNRITVINEMTSSRKWKQGCKTRNIATSGCSGGDEEDDDEDAMGNKAVDDTLIQAMAKMKQENDNGSDQIKIFDAVAALLNINKMKDLRRRKTNWEEELRALCPVQLAVYSGNKVLISDSTENLHLARDTLIKMLLSVDQERGADRMAEHKCNTEVLDITPDDNVQDEDVVNRNIKRECHKDSSLNLSASEEECRATAVETVTAQMADAASTCTEVDDITQEMDAIKSGVKALDTTELPAIQGDDNRMLTDPENVLVKNKNQDEKVNVNCNHGGARVMSGELDSRSEGLVDKTPSFGSTGAPMSQEEVVKLIDKLESGLLTEEVDPAEVWKILVKPYTRSERTSKKEVTEDDLITCDLCKEYRGTEAAIFSHKRRRHPRVVYKCDLCGKAFGVRYACLMHRVTHLGRGMKHQIHRALQLERQRRDSEVKHINVDRMHDNITRSGNSTLVKNPEKAVHKCQYCTYRGTRVGVTSHTLRYHPKRVYKCSECGKTYGTKYQMDVHVESHLMKCLREAKKRQAYEMALLPGKDQPEVCLPDEYKRIHQCDICGFRTTKSALTQHKHRHHQEKSFQCDLCNKWFARQCEFNSHRASHFDQDGNLRNIRKVAKEDLLALDDSNVKKSGPGDSPVDNLNVTGAEESDSVGLDEGKSRETASTQKCANTESCACDICGFRITKDRLHVHKMKRHKPARFECNICCKVFHLNSVMQRHRSTHFTETGELKPWLKQKCGLSEENLKCDECDIVFKSGRSMEIHVAKKHKKTKQYMCEFCLYRGFTKNDVDLHVARMHRSHEHKCDKCGKAYAFAKELDRHLAVVHQGREQCKCHLCGQEFKMIRYLKNHLERHEGKFRCFCSVCGKGFMDNCRLKEHEQTHKPSGERDHKYHCDICQKGFLRRSTWQQHMNGHYQNRCHKCNICGKAFTLPQTLWKHKLRHKAHKPYPCEYPGCSKAFFDKTAYQYHYVIHTGKSDHQCNTCGKVFTQAATLRRHVCKMAFQQFSQKTDDLEMAESVADSQRISTKSDDIISVVGSSSLDSVGQTIVIQPEQLALLNQLEGNNQVVQAVDSPVSMKSVMIILSEAKQGSKIVQGLEEETPRECAVTGNLIISQEMEAAETPGMTQPGGASQKLENAQHVDAHQNERVMQNLAAVEESAVAQSDSQSEQYLCSICEQLFSTWDEIKEHMILHTGENSDMTLSVVDPSGQVTTEEVVSLQMIPETSSHAGSEINT